MQRERTRDPDPLALAPAERVREAPHVLGAQPDTAQQIGHARFTLPATLHAVDEQRLADQIEQRHARVQRRERVLENHLHLATQRSELARPQLADLDHRAVPHAHEDFARRRLDGPQDAPRRRGLAAPALAHQPQRFAFVDVEADAVHRPDVPDRPLQESLADGKQLLQAGDAEQRIGAHHW